MLGALEPERLSYAWRHPDPRMDRLHKEVNALVEKDVHALEDPMVTFQRVWSLVSGKTLSIVRPPADRERAPRLSEPWFC